MAKSARNMLTDEPLDVLVTDAKDAGKNLIILYFKIGKKAFADMFNVSEKLKKEALKARSKKTVRAVLVADSTDDLDGHPSVKGVKVA